MPARLRPPIHFSEELANAPSDLCETIEAVVTAALDEAERRIVAVTAVEAYKWECPEEVGRFPVYPEVEW